MDTFFVDSTEGEDDDYLMRRFIDVIGDSGHEVESDDKVMLFMIVGLVRIVYSGCDDRMYLLFRLLRIIDIVEDDLTQSLIAITHEGDRPVIEDTMEEVLLVDIDAFDLEGVECLNTSIEDSFLFDEDDLFGCDDTEVHLVINDIFQRMDISGEEDDHCDSDTDDEAIWLGHEVISSPDDRTDQYGREDKWEDNMKPQEHITCRQKYHLIFAIFVSIEC